MLLFKLAMLSSLLVSAQSEIVISLREDCSAGCQSCGQETPVPNFGCFTLGSAATLFFCDPTGSNMTMRTYFNNVTLCGGAYSDQTHSSGQCFPVSTWYNQYVCNVVGSSTGSASGAEAWVRPNSAMQFMVVVGLIAALMRPA